MNTPLRPLGHKLIVRPDAAPTITESGFYIPETAQDIPAMSGTVIRLGDGPARDKHIRASAIAHCLSILHEARVEARCPADALVLAGEELERYLRRATDLGHVCHVGQRVIFPMEAGHEIVLNEATEDAVVILSEDSLLAVYDAQETAEVAA